jgi:hypothetical protein
MTKLTATLINAQLVRQRFDELKFPTKPKIAQYRIIGILLDVSPDAVRRWMLGDNGITYVNAVKLSHVLGVHMVHLSPLHKDYAAPWVDREEAIAQVNRNFVTTWGRNAAPNEPEFVTALRERLNIVPTTKGGEPMNPVIPKAVGGDLKKKLFVAVPNEPVDEPVDDANAIRLMLHQAEKFRQRNNITWVVRDNGTLGAKRVTVETF